MPNFEPNFEEKLKEFCDTLVPDSEYNFMPLYYKDYSRMIDTDNINEAEALTWVFPKHMTIKLPKQKLITIEYIIEKFNQHSVYTNLSKYLNKFLEYSGSVYPTSYGIGIFRFFTDVPKISTKIENWLKSQGIEYYNEYSDAGWVYRFKISKSQANIEKIQNLQAL